MSVHCGITGYGPRRIRRYTEGSGSALSRVTPDPRLLRLMIEEAPVSQELRDTIARHGKLRTACSPWS